jgi:UDP-glucose 4-epimerase
VKIIVTGGAGFIGSHIVDAYVKADRKVVVVDNLSTSSKRNINPGAKFYKADIRDAQTIEKIFKKEGPGIVSHHAALVDVVKSVADPIGTIETNTLGTLNLLLALGKYGRGNAVSGKKFIFASSAAVYGDPKKIPVGEGGDTAPLSPYGLSKLLSEDIIKFYSRQLNFQYLIFRYANVYGPRQRGNVVSVFSSLIKGGKQPAIFGDGTKKRDYIHVSDIVRANLFGLKRGRNIILNLGSEKPTSDKKVFDAISRNLRFTKPPLYKPQREGEIYKMVLASRKAKKILGWWPKVQFEKGIRRTLAGI